MIGSWANAIPRDVAWQEVLLTDVDILYARYKIEQLTSAYPFKKTAITPNVPQPTNLIEQLAYGRYYGKTQWLDENPQLLQYYKEQEDMAHMTQVGLNLADAVTVYAEYPSLARELHVGALT